MIGSILGDIAGSVYEFHNIKTKEFPFLTPQKGYTDDSILTLATATGCYTEETVPPIISAMPPVTRVRWEASADVSVNGSDRDSKRDSSVLTAAAETVRPCA